VAILAREYGFVAGLLRVVEILCVILVERREVVEREWRRDEIASRWGWEVGSGVRSEGVGLRICG
jgi:hypothetical protein